MKISDFDYSYPEELVAQKPLPERARSRMMVVDRANKSIAHSHILELPKFLKQGDLVVMNDTRVVPARIFGRRGKGEEIELLVVEPSDRKDVWRCLLKRAKRIRPGEQFFFGMQSTAKALGREGEHLLVEFKRNSLELAMKHHGVPPLPPYIRREGFKSYTEEDRERYQTVFARTPGSAAAPTAGLHFDDALIKKMNEAGAKVEHVTLHVGIDTFAPVRVDDVDAHRMHGEAVEVSRQTAETVSVAKGRGERVVAIGTTSVRSLESAAEMAGSDKADGTFAWKKGKIAFGRWTTDIFIKPGYEFKVVDAILTNFHQPRSTLIMLVSAFAGREFILSCYEEAIKERYRLFSYGDCMLII
jgi:S-adenosylmethionine:tRNA ribosyltransferase-isomerase